MSSDVPNRRRPEIDGRQADRSDPLLLLLAAAPVLFVLGLLDALARAGARLAWYHPAALDGRAVAFAALLALLFLPRWPLSPGRLSGLLALVVAAGSGAVIAASGLDPGPPAGATLAGIVQDGRSVSAVELRPGQIAGWYRLSQAVGRQSGYRLTARGTFLAPEDGVYHFDAECRGGCRVEVAGRSVVTVAAGGETSGEITLGAGAHSYVLEVDDVGRPFARVGWERPALLRFLPEERMLGGDLTLEQFNSKEGALRNRCLWLALSWGLGGVAFLRFAAAIAGWRARLWRSARRAWANAPIRRALLTGALVAATVTAAHALVAPQAEDGLHVHAWSSEKMMQTVSAADLRAEPFRSLFYLHIQPPAFDALRAVLAWRHDAVPEDQLVDAIDRDLYRVWALAAGLLAALVQRWLDELVGATVAVVSTWLFVLHPAFLFYATFLDTTLVSAAGFTWIVYELWRLSRAPESSWRLSLALSLTFLTRSVVQWPFAVVIAAAMALLGISPPRIIRALLPFALLVLLFSVKQYALFGVGLTSTFGPYNFCRGLSVACPGTTPVELPDLPEPEAAAVLRRNAKLSGDYNWNQLAALERSFSMMHEYREHLEEVELGMLARIAGRSVVQSLTPSSRHTPHLLVDAIPWREAYDAVMSGWTLATLVVVSCCFAIFGPGRPGGARRRDLGLALPSLYVLAVTNLFESGENMRFKFFVEPLVWVLVWVTAAEAWALLRSRRGAGTRGGPGSTPNAQP